MTSVPHGAQSSGSMPAGLWAADSHSFELSPMGASLACGNSPVVPLPLSLPVTWPALFLVMGSIQEGWSACWLSEVQVGVLVGTHWHEDTTRDYLELEDHRP